jgi:Co/Zn/Cd efflux system component
MRDIVIVLMEGKCSLSYFFIFISSASGVPSNVNYARVVDDILHLPGARNAHSLHIWSLSLQKSALSVHIAIGEH